MFGVKSDDNLYVPLNLTHWSLNFNPFGEPAASEYRLSSEYFIAPPMSVHCEKPTAVAMVFAVSRKKQNVSITNTTDYRVP
jgi:hypothetical protein